MHLQTCCYIFVKVINYGGSLLKSTENIIENKETQRKPKLVANIGFN